MIHIRQQPLPEIQQVALVKHLSSEGHTLLMSVLEGKIDTHMIDAMTPALESKDAEPKIDVANEALRSAQRYQTCLDVLAELKHQKEPFTLAKVT